MTDDLDVLEKFFKIFREYESTTQMSEEFFQEKFINTGLMKRSSTMWEWVGADYALRDRVTSLTEEQQESYDRCFEGYYKSHKLASGLAVRKDFLMEILTLGSLGVTKAIYLLT